MIRPAVIGAGSWGTALALVLARQGHTVRLWVRSAELAERIGCERINSAYLPGFALHPGIEISTSLQDVVSGSAVVVTAVPSHALREVLAAAAPAFLPGVTLVSATKGLEEHTLLRMSEVIRQSHSGSVPVVLSGPSFAREIAAELPAALVAASTDPSRCQQVQALFGSPRFRVYASEDPVGTELGGAVKNVIAIAAGVCHGLHLGQNAVAALITRGLAEMSRLSVAMGALPQTLSGLAGLGDLVLTCTGELSRNRQVGIELASGKPVEQITGRMHAVAEGVRTAAAVVALGMRHHVDLPISQQVDALLHRRCSPTQAISSLLERSPRGE